MYAISKTTFCFYRVPKRILSNACRFTDRNLIYS